MTFKKISDEDTQVRLLLPWAASGRISSADLQRVQALVARSKEAQAELAWWRSVSRDLLVESPEVRDAMQGDLGLSQFKQRLGSTPRHPKKSSAWYSNFWSLAWLRRQWMAPALALSLCVVVGQGVFIQSMGDQTVDTIRPLAASADIDGAQLSLSFQPHVTEQAIRTLLQEVDGEIVAGPSALGRYRIRVRGDVNRAIERLHVANLVVAEVAIEK